MPGVKLRYRRATFIPPMALLGFALIFLNAFLDMTMFRDMWAQVAAALASGALFLFLGISPFLANHSIEGSGLWLRQGWYFRAELPFANILNLEMVDRGPRRTGVYFRMTGSSLFVTTQRRDLFLLNLRQPQRFGFALGKRADKVYFDTVDRDLLLRQLHKRGITPANPDPQS